MEDLSNPNRGMSALIKGNFQLSHIFLPLQARELSHVKHHAKVHGRGMGVGGCNKNKGPTYLLGALGVLYTGTTLYMVYMYNLKWKLK